MCGAGVTRHTKAGMDFFAHVAHIVYDVCHIRRLAFLATGGTNVTRQSETWNAFATFAFWMNQIYHYR